MIALHETETPNFLGERARGINQNGMIHIRLSEDTPSHEEQQHLVELLLLKTIGLV